MIFKVHVHLMVISNLSSHTWVQVCRRCCARLAVIVLEHCVLKTIVADKRIIIETMFIVSIILRHYWKAGITNHHIDLICWDRVLSVQWPTQITKPMSWRGILWMNVWMMVKMRICRLQNVRVLLASTEFGVLWDMKDIFSTITAGLTDTIFINIVVIYVIGCWVWQRIYLLER